MHKDNEFQNDEELVFETEDASSTNEDIIEDDSFEQEDDYNEDIDNLYDEDEEVRKNYNYHNNYNRNRFGEKEYREATDEKGIYNKEYYKNKESELDEKVKEAETEKNKDWKMKDPNEKGPVNADGSNSVSKNKFDKLRDNFNVAKAKKNALENRISGAKADAFNMMHPTEALKAKAKAGAKDLGKKAADGAKEAGKKAGQAAGAAIKKAAASIGKLIASHPVVALIAIVVFLVLLLLIILFMSLSSAEEGYYDQSCDFNKSIIACSNGQVFEYKEYVISKTYELLDGDNYGEGFSKAIMLIVKTNALAAGNYNSETKELYLNDCANNVSVDSEKYAKLEQYYEDTYELLYLKSHHFNTSLTNLSESDLLSFDDSVFIDLKQRYQNSGSYESILESYYDNGRVQTPNQEQTPEHTNIARKNFFIGDSRTVGMMSAVSEMNSSNTVARESQGYNWFSSTAVSEANNKMGNDSYNIFIWLGVNDLSNASQYATKYYELATGSWSHHNIIIVSVGPVIDGMSNATNASISSFNSSLRQSIDGFGLSNLKYKDLGLLSVSPSDARDGLHYSSSYYNTIHKMMVSNVSSISSNRNAVASGNYNIFNLADNCSYFELSELDSGDNSGWWWPIGSRETSFDGKMATGAPQTTNVTAPFKSMDSVHNGNHSGIDIAPVEKGVDNVIASKSGTVIYPGANDNISHGDGSLNHSGYGNYVIIDHGDGFSTLYGHMYKDTITVRAGDHVEQGQIIGKTGTSGRSTGPHLHFEVRINNVPVDPLSGYVDANNPRPVATPRGIGSINIADTGGLDDICKSMIDSGYSRNATAAVLVNIAGESGARSNNMENCYECGQCCKVNGRDYGYCVYGHIIGAYCTDQKYTQGVDSGAYPRSSFVNDHVGYGIVQWTFSTRKAAFYDYAKRVGRSIGSLGTQVGFMLEEVQGYPVVYSYLTGNYSTNDIAYRFCRDYENPAGDCQARVNEYTSQMNAFVSNGCR